MSGVYQCFSQRRSDVFTEENVQLYLPVADSFWFTAHLRSLTSGQALSQLVFSHLDIINQAPCL
jgi:elongation factor 2